MKIKGGTEGVVLGVDPGRIGAAVVLDGTHVREVVTWSTTKDIAPLVFDLCRRWNVKRAAVEWTSETHGARERMTPKARATLAQRAQMAASGAACAGVPDVVYVGPKDWRSEVLRLSRSSSGEDAKRAAEGACWGGVVRRLSVDLGLVWPALVERSSHVAEAACVAVWAQRG
jgi:hypothetical protein